MNCEDIFLSITFLSADCLDSSNQCYAWAERGECDKSPGYMLNNCKNACNNCGLGISHISYE